MYIHISFLLLYNKLPQNSRLNTTFIYFLTVSIGQKFGHSIAHLGSLLGQSYYYVTTNSPLGDTEDYTRVLDYSGTNQKTRFYLTSFQTWLFERDLKFVYFAQKKTMFL